MRTLRYAAVLKLGEVEQASDREINLALKVRAHIPELAHLSVKQLSELWSAFDYDREYSVMHAEVTEELLKDFWTWCCEDVRVKEEIYV